MRLKHNIIKQIVAVAVFTMSLSAARAQVVFLPVFTQTRLEARADFNYWNTHTAAGDIKEYGFQGRYFNFIAAGNLSEQFSYFFRQRIQATPGTPSLFDNTDFLYLNYTPNKHWMFRLGKDALAVGGFEYDAAPIDVLFSTHYWDNFYCFQLGAAAAYKSDNGNHTILLQVANSPYVHYGAPVGTGLGQEFKSGLSSHSLFWSGKFGHFRTLYSVNLFEREEGSYMNYIALGHEVSFDRWDLYLDLIHHALAKDDWGKNFAVVSCMNVLLTDDLNFFVKGSYEQNHSEADYVNFSKYGRSLDCLVEAGHTYLLAGAGLEYRPKNCKNVRLHGFMAWRRTLDDSVFPVAPGGQVVGASTTTNTLNANMGITWDMDIHKMFKQRLQDNAKS